jgi:D-sedoheptulose 7-phosphate isomerase
MTEFETSLHDAISVFESLRELERDVQIAARWCVEALAADHKLLICGNGGSASEAQHLAGELMGRYKKSRPPLAAIALVSDAAVLTCIGNDYCFEDIFARQLRALARPHDILIVFSTSGNSPNILVTLRNAREIGVKSIAFLGKDGGQARSLAECSLVVKHENTARAQEAHQFLLHCLMDQIEAGLERLPKSSPS